MFINDSAPNTALISGNPIKPTFGYIIINKYSPLSLLNIGITFTHKNAATGNSITRIRTDMTNSCMFIDPFVELKTEDKIRHGKVTFKTKILRSFLKTG
jgi:hypothetical protein